MKDNLEVRGRRLFKEPAPGKRNKFVITEDEAWFLPIEDNAIAPRLIELLTAVVGDDRPDEETVEALDRKLEDGLILMGYASERAREVSIHSPTRNLDNESVRKRLDGVFGKGSWNVADVP